MRSWRDAGWTNAKVAINVSAQQFISGDFLGDVERLLELHGLPPDAIELELTENMLQTGAITVETLRALKMMGIMTALDDFGTGYSSLTSLERLPLSRVKLDRSVLAEVDSNPRAASIANSIIALCRSLGLQVTIEGLERTSQLDFLSACGDVSVQGYLVARPADASEILDIAGRMGPRMRALLDAAEGGRVHGFDDDSDGTVRRLRRRVPEVPVLRFGRICRVASKSDRTVTPAPLYKNGCARSSSSSSPGSLESHGLPGWMIDSWQLSAASTSCR